MKRLAKIFSIPLILLSNNINLRSLKIMNKSTQNSNWWLTRNMIKNICKVIETNPSYMKKYLLKNYLKPIRYSLQIVSIIKRIFILKLIYIISPMVSYPFSSKQIIKKLTQLSNPITISKYIFLSTAAIYLFHLV